MPGLPGPRLRRAARPSAPSPQCAGIVLDDGKGLRESPDPHDDPACAAARGLWEALCRWLAYSGSPVLLEDLLFKPEHSLIDQSLHSQLGAKTTNGDGFGVGWYGVGDTPGVYHSIEPAWNDRNLRELAGTRRSPLVFAHIRASTGTAVQQTNCHPFRHGRWLWMHNGAIRGLRPREARPGARRRPELYPEIEGSTDSEMFFYLALTFGLEEDPPRRSQRGRRLHRGDRPAARRRASDPDDGRDHGRRDIWAFRYSSEGDSRSLFFSTDVRDAAVALPRGRACCRRSRRRVAAGRLRTARRPRRSVERGAGVELRHRPAGPGRDAPVHADAMAR